jgi:hypothetical protein
MFAFADLKKRTSAGQEQSLFRVPGVVKFNSAQLLAVPKTLRFT